MTPFQARNIQDMWPEPDARKVMERMFNPGPKFIPLGLLTRDGAIYAIHQEVEPGSLIEKTSAQTRRPFRHAVIRQEVNNMKGNTWPYVVFEEQPRVIYRLQNVQDLLRWLVGLAVAFSVIIFASRITQLLTCCGVKGQDCMALTEEGKIFHWARGTLMASQTGILSEQLQVSPTSQGSSISVDVMGNERTPGLQTMPIPAITRLLAGVTYGAAIARTGQLYIFLTGRPSHNSENECIDPTPAEFYISGSNPFTVCDPYTPCPNPRSRRAAHDHRCSCWIRAFGSVDVQRRSIYIRRRHVRSARSGGCTTVRFARHEASG